MKKYIVSAIFFSLIGMSSFVQAGNRTQTNETLREACQKGRLKLVNQLLESKTFDINDVMIWCEYNSSGQGDEYRWHTALHLAVLNNHPRVVDALLADPEIDVSIKNGDRKTALEIALELGYTTIANKIKKHMEAKRSEVQSEEPNDGFCTVS